jgi:hypothetical protein
MRTELISSPSKVTSTCTVPFSVLMVEPWTTCEASADPDEEEEDEEEEEGDEGVGAGAATSVLDVVSIDGA